MDLGKQSRGICSKTEQNHKVNTMLVNNEGVVGIMVAMILPILMVFLALAVDISRTYAIRTKLASAQDAAILAAAVTPDEYRFNTFSACSGASCPPSGAIAQNVDNNIGTSEYAKKYLALNLGSSYLGKDVSSISFSEGVGAEAGAIIANSANVTVDPVFIKTTGGITGVGTEAKVYRSAPSVTTPVLLGFVLDVSGSMGSGVGDGSGLTRAEALEQSLWGYLDAIAVTDSNGNQSLPAGYEIAFADFSRDSGYRLARSLFVYNAGKPADTTDTNPPCLTCAVLQGNESDYYDTNGFLLTNTQIYEADGITPNEYYNPYWPNNRKIPDTMDFTKNYSVIGNFVGGGPNTPRLLCQVPTATAFIGCNFQGSQSNYYRIAIDPIPAHGDRSGGSCASCGLFKISEFFAAKEDANDVNFKPYGLPCGTNNVCSSYTRTRWGYTSAHVTNSEYPYYQRIIVIMSDGAFINLDETNKNSDPAFTGQLQREAYGSTIYRYKGPSPRLDGTFEVTYNTCDALRAAGYKIIAVQFGNTRNATYSGAMKRCATGDSNQTAVDIYNPLTNTTTHDQVYFTAETAEELKTAFTNIGKVTVSSHIRTVK